MTSVFFFRHQCICGFNMYLLVFVLTYIPRRPPGGVIVYLSQERNCFNIFYSCKNFNDASDFFRHQCVYDFNMY